MPFDLPRPRPQRVTLEGRYVRLEPLSHELHYDSLLAACTAPGAAERFRYLFEGPQGPAELTTWFRRVQGLEDPLFYAVIDRASGRCEGRQALMRIVPEHGVIELGSIFWGAAIARTRVATEALYLSASYVFDELGYRRFEWKCDALNQPSRRAALRFGFQFESVFRQHMVVKGLNRDTAWFAMLDGDWPRLRAGYQAWLAPENFGPDGRQRRRLGEVLAGD
ncbi:MAG: GNAT family protein [Trueperaceae bacterium]